MNRTLLHKLALVALLTLWVFGADGAGTASAAKWDERYFPNLPVVTQEGKTLNFYDDLIKDKIVVINFIYASCQDVCPLLTARMARVQAQLGSRVGKDIFMYSITMDPEHDSPEILKAHAEAFHVKPGWLFLTGKPEDLHQIRHKLGERSRKLEEHRHDVVLGNDRTAEWMRSSVFQDRDRLVMEILDMDPVWRANKRFVPRKQQGAIPTKDIQGHPGQALFVKACSSCHTIGHGDFVGPDLAGVLRRRDRHWLTQFLMSPDGMRGKKDRIAMELSARFPGVSMPNLGLSQTDVGDLLVYLETQEGHHKATVAAAPHTHGSHATHNQGHTPK